MISYFSHTFAMSIRNKSFLRNKQKNKTIKSVYKQLKKHCLLETNKIIPLGSYFLFPLLYIRDFQLKKKMMF